MWYSYVLQIRIGQSEVPLFEKKNITHNLTTIAYKVDLATFSKVLDWIKAL